MPDRDFDADTITADDYLNIAFIDCDRSNMIEPLLESSALSDSPPKITLPAYMEPLSQQIEFEDVQYLWRNGAFSIPDISLRNELLLSDTI